MHLSITNPTTYNIRSTSCCSTHEKKNKSLPLPFTAPKTSHYLFKKIVRCLKGEKNPLVNEIKKIAKNQGLITEIEKASKILEAIESIDYLSLKKDLRLIIKQMTNEERKILFETALKQDFEKKQKFLGNQCMHLMTLEQFRTLSHSISSEFKDLKTTVNAYYEISQTIQKYHFEQAKQQKDSKPFILFRIVGNLIRTLLVALNLLDLEKEPNTYFETKYLLDIYWRLLEIPFKICKFIFQAILNPLISISVIAVSAVVSAVSVHIFNRCFKKVPDQLPYCMNMTAEMGKGSINPIFGRDKELEEILEALAANNNAGRKHPLLIGPQGVGKTELIKGLAWRLAKGQVPDTLKGKKLFYLNSAELLKVPSGFVLKDPLEQIIHKIDGYQKDVIVVFDEAHNLVDTLGERFNSILDTSTNSLYYAIGITTPKEYREKIETAPLDRRFEKKPIGEASEKQTRTILRHINQQQAPDIKISKKTLNTIYQETEDKILHRHQPDKSIFVLSKALEKIRQKQNGGDFEIELRELFAQREDLTSRLSRKKLHGLSLQSEKIQKIKDELISLDAMIAEVQLKIQEKKCSLETLISLKKQLEWHENWLHKISEKIASEEMKGKKTPEMLEKLYLFNLYILIPQLEKYIADFTETHHIETQIDESMIGEIVNELVENETNKAKISEKAENQTPENQLA